MPDPLLPPVPGAALSATEREAARAAVASGERGDFARADRRFKELPADHPVGALVRLELRFLRGESVARQAMDFAIGEPGYASAWGMAALASQREGDAHGALTAVRRAAELQPGEAWSKLTAELENALAGGLVAEGGTLLQTGDASGALKRAREALEAVPNFGSARVLAVRALLTLRDIRGAAELVPGLPDSVEGLELKGKVAEVLGQWDLALDFYSRLPASDSRRCELVEAARQQWRLTNAPPYLTSALAARPLHRRHLAAILTWEAPALVGQATGAVPVFEDVVQLPERRDVLTVARAGVVPGDPIARRFNPDHTVSPRELGAALDRLAHVLRRPDPRWCLDDGTGCLHLPDVVDGESAAALVRQIAGGGGEPCAQR